MKEVKPINDKILIQLIPEETETAGGLYIPDTAKNKPNKGIVIAVGEGVELTDGTVRPLPITKGENVLFTEGRGIEVKLENTTNDYMIISIKDILGKFN